MTLWRSRPFGHDFQETLDLGQLLQDSPVVIQKEGAEGVVCPLASLEEREELG